MSRRIVLLSGHVGTGKTTLADGLVQRFGGLNLRTSQLLSRHLENETDLDRRRLQDAGDALDRRTSGTWVRDALVRELRDSHDESLVFVDAVRIQRQIEAIRSTFGPRVTHVHLTAPRRTLSRRYRERSRRAGKSPGSAIRELASFDEVLLSTTEQQVESLEAYADIVVDSHRSTKLDVQIRVASYLGLYGPRDARLVDILVGGQYGSEGKGHIAATLAPEYGLLMRVGGPNAGHTVCLAGGETYTHHQLPSGTLSSTAKLVLAPGSVLRVPTLMREIAECSVEVDRLSIDPQAMIISDDDIHGEEEGILGDIGSTYLLTCA